METENGHRAVTDPRQMAVHSVRAQLHAIRAQVDGALASLALLDGSSTVPPQPNAGPVRRPRTEAEADFFGKVRAGAEAAPDSAELIPVGEQADAR